MAGQQELQRQKQTQSISQHERDEQMLREDKQAIAQYQQSEKREFRVSSKKTLARNYRDYEIYRSLQTPQLNVYGRRQESAEYITDRYAMIDGMKEPERLKLPGTELKAKDLLMNLCRTGLLEKSVSTETMKALTDHLTAGRMWEEGDNPNATEQLAMNRAGMEALREIYFQHLSALDKKYGEKLTKLTPTQYLKAMPALEQDLCVVEDMQKFFAAYHSTDNMDERFELMKKKMDFYAETWAVLRDRARLFVDMDPEQLTEKGELSKQAGENYDQKMRMLREQAKKDGTFKTWKKSVKKPGEYFAQTQARKSEALNALTAYKKEARQREAKISERQAALQVLTKKIEDFQLYQNYKQILETDTGLSAGRRKTVQELCSKYEENVRNSRKSKKTRDMYILTEEELNQTAERLAALLAEDRRDTVVQPDEENAREVAEAALRSGRELLTFITESTDQELITQYAQKRTELETILAQWNAIGAAGIYADIKEALDAHQKNEKVLSPALVEQYQQTYQAYQDFRTFTAENGSFLVDGKYTLEKRMSEIAKYGCSQGRSLKDRAGLSDNSSRLKEVLKKGIKEQKNREKQTGQRTGEQKNILEALSATSSRNNIISPIMEERIEAVPSVMKELAVYKRIRDWKNQAPNYYRFGQSYSSYLRCEHQLKLLPVLENLLSLLLRMNHVNMEGQTVEDEASIRELEQQFQEQRELFVGLYNEQGTDAARWADRLSGELSSGLVLNETKKTYLTEHAAELGDARTLENIKLETTALSFLEVPKEGQDTPLHQATLQHDIRCIKDLMDFTDAGEEADLSDEAAQSALLLLYRFHDCYDRVMQALTVKGVFEDHSLVEHRAELEQCAWMAGFLNVHLLNNGLSKKLSERLDGDEFAEQDLAMLEDLVNQIQQIQMLYYAAQARALRQAEVERLFEVTGKDIAFPNILGQETVLTQANLSYTENIYKELSEAELRKMRISYEEEHRKEELRDLELRTRVQNAVGREWIASARKGEAVKHTRFTDYIGNGLGKPLHFFSWLLRNKRSMNHGAVCYEQSREMYQRTLATMQDQQSLLNEWGRGDGQYAPKVELRKYFSSQLKITIKEAINAAKAAPGNYDFADETFKCAIEAMNCYCGIEGIVNSDTTEMEMAFLDTFQKQAAIYMENHEGIGQAPEIQSAMHLLYNIQDQLDQNLKGTLKDTMSAEEFRLIRENTVAYVEDTTYTSNIEESNIKDIPLFLHEPNINDVRQSTIGDCWLVSAIGSVVKTNPEFIRSMFQDLGNGDVIVRLFSAVDAHGNNVSYKEDLWNKGVHFQPAYFKVRKHYETGYGNASDCPWVQLLEKAYALGGYNTRNVMEVRGNRLYNVPDELTMGQIDQAVAHLTGHLPESVRYNRKIESPELLDMDVCSGMVAGLSEMEAAYLETALYAYRIPYKDMKKDQTCVITHDSFRELMLSAGCRDNIAGAWRSARNLQPNVELSAQEMDEAIEHYWGIMQANLQRMMNGEELPFANYQGQYKREETAIGEDGFSKIEHRMMYTRGGRYSLPLMNTILKFRRCIEEGGCVSVSIPHCVSILDVQQKDGIWFFLMRDPFNIYNSEYTQKGKKVSRTSNGFGSVLTGQNGNRHLQNSREETVRGGFRGTSWIEAQELYDQFTSVYLIKPEYTQIPDYH